MKHWWFGYSGCPLVYTLHANDIEDLLQQIDAKGMREPDWVDGE